MKVLNKDPESEMTHIRKEKKSNNSLELIIIKLFLKKLGLWRRGTERLEVKGFERHTILSSES